VAGDTGGHVCSVEALAMTFEQFLDIDVPEGTTPRDGLRLCWDAAYSQGHTDGLLKHIRGEYDRYGKEISHTGAVI